MDFSPITIQPNPPMARSATMPPPLNLVDPITSKQLKLDSPFEDKLLQLTPWQNFKLGLKQTFIELPKSVVHGLKGDSSYTFSDFLSITKIPYYLGGAVLALSFRAGRDKVNFIRQALGVGLYYLGVMGANKAIDAVYKHRYGIDLGMKFRKSNGDIEKVFASADFPRLDLLKPEHYALMRKKMGIPDNVADPKAETNEEIHRIIGISRADKLILGNILAALGAGYLARSNGWARILGSQGTFRKIWSDPLQGGVWNKLVNTGTALKGLLGQGIREKITGLPGEAAPWMRKSVLGGVAAFCALILAHAWFTRREASCYESTLLTPSLGQGEAYLKSPDVQVRSLSSSRNSAFAAFVAARGGSPVAFAGQPAIKEAPHG